MHCVIDAARSRRLNDPAYRAIAASVAIFGGLDHDVSFVFGGALFGCFGPGTQHDVWKSSVTDFVGMGYLNEQPRQHHVSLFDHLIGCGEQRRRYGQASCFCGLQVDYEFVFGRRLHWQVGRFLALENAINIAGRAPVIGDWI
jgi:hypothetical protein